MAEWEICQVVQMRRTGWGKGVGWWEARLATSQGEVTIARSAEFPCHPKGFRELASEVMGRDIDQIWQERRRAAHSQVVAQLVAQGWEPAGTNDEGLLSVMKRAVS